MTRPAPASWHHAVAGAVVGVAGVAAMTAMWAVESRSWFAATAFPPLAAAQWLVQRAPGGLDTFAIEHLGHAALPLEATLTAVTLLVIGTMIGAIAGALGGARTAIWTPAIVGAMLLPLPGVSFPLVAIAVAVAVAWLVARCVERRPESPDVPDTYGGAAAAEPGVQRRSLLIAFGAGLGAMAFGLLGPGGPWRRSATPEVALDPLTFQTRAKVPLPAPGDAGFRSIPGLTPRVTSVGDFYVVDEALVDPALDPALWSLAIHGEVERPTQWSLDDLLAMPAVERYQTLACISNPVGGQLISTTKWTGVPLARLLQGAGPSPDVIEVVFRSADGYSESLPVDIAMDPSTLIAYGMDGRALPVAHGFPARLLSTGTYGMKNPKWLQDIELVRTPFAGFWETRGWSKKAVVKTWCRIDTPVSGRQGSGPTTIAGVAFAGARGIAFVEVSTDDGATWGRAVTETPLSPYTWVRWSYRWLPAETGLHTIRARAWDGDGVVQPAAFAPEHPDGASGYPVMAFTIDSL